jgi:signal transduction histidine kinase
MRLVEKLADGVAHEFNNIFCVMKMAADDLNKESVISDIGREAIGDILAMVERGTSLTRQLLVIGGCENFQPRDLDLNELIAGKAKLLKHAVGGRVDLQFKRAAQPIMVHADPGMMDQLVSSLVVNARDAMHEGGKLVIETAGVEFDEIAVSQSAGARVGSFASLCVSDSGCGIPPELLADVFDPFFTTKGSSKNPGLGLATVSGIVRQHQGWVSVDSEVGRGAIFRAYIPRIAGAKCAAELENSWAL